MTKDKLRYPIVIIGGGPAGLATSLTLSARKIKHCIVEAQARPFLKPGEAIPPNARPLLRQLGIEHLLQDKAHHPYYGNKSYWGNAQLHQEEFMKEVHGHGYLLDRMHFEKQLRELAKASEFCSFYEGYRLQGILTTKEEVRIEINNAKEKETVIGAYVVDATGRKASVCRHLGVEKQQLDQQFTVFGQASLPTSVEQQIYIEANEKGWWYAAPIGANKLSLMFFTTRELLPIKNKIFNFLTIEKTISPLMSKLLEGAKMDQASFQIMPSGTTCLDIPYGHRWLAVGDAAYSYDPISSYGITSALAGAYYGAQALADSFQGKEDALMVYRYLMENAFQVYLKKLKMQYQQEKRWKNCLYWKKRVGEIIV